MGFGKGDWLFFETIWPIFGVSFLNFGGKFQNRSKRFEEVLPQWTASSPVRSILNATQKPLETWRNLMSIWAKKNRSDTFHWILVVWWDYGAPINGRTLLIEVITPLYWLFHRNPYFMASYNPYITGNPDFIRKQKTANNRRFWSLLCIYFCHSSSEGINQFFPTHLRREHM